MKREAALRPGPKARPASRPPGRTETQSGLRFATRRPSGRGCPGRSHSGASPAGSRLPPTARPKCSSMISLTCWIVAGLIFSNSNGPLLWNSRNWCDPRTEEEVVGDERGRFRTAPVVPGFQVGIELLAAQFGQIGSADDLDRHRHLAARREEDQIGQRPEHAAQSRCDPRRDACPRVLR